MESIRKDLQERLSQTQKEKESTQWRLDAAERGKADAEEKAREMEKKVRGEELSSCVPNLDSKRDGKGECVGGEIREMQQPSSSNKQTLYGFSPSLPPPHPPQKKERLDDFTDVVVAGSRGGGGGGRDG